MKYIKPELMQNFTAIQIINSYHDQVTREVSRDSFWSFQLPVSEIFLIATNSQLEEEL